MEGEGFDAQGLAAALQNWALPDAFAHLRQLPSMTRYLHAD